MTTPEDTPVPPNDEPTQRHDRGTHAGDDETMADPDSGAPVPAGPSSARVATGETAEVPPPIPDRLGPYRVLGEIGRGGMGSVYSAVRVDDAFKKRVAIKVLRRGLDTEDMLTRFELERQVLSAIAHPNIARVFDAGGTPDGRPYFVMELVEGKPIDVYCDEHNLSVPARLALFSKVCAAVHVAHQNLIVHRDIKPANILVTGDGEPKLLDFGIAKLLNPEMAAIDPMTRPDQRLLTYEYASPEQVTGDPITTASDVYALGVLLYELLTGHRPYRLERRVHEEALRVICSTEPARPSTAVTREVTVRGPGNSTLTITAEEIARRREMQLARLKRRLTGDLDNIILMAMRKTPHRRYTSAEALAQDISRHLTGQTVIARPPTWDYRAGKFVKRHRAAVIGACSVVLVLAGGLAATAWQWQEAEAARVRAERAEAETRARIDDLRRSASWFDAFERDVERVEGATRVRSLLLSAVLTGLDALPESFDGDPALRLAKAAAHRRAGRLAGGPGGDISVALGQLRLAEGLLGELDHSTPVRLETAHVDFELSRVLERGGDPAEAQRRARASADAALDLAEQSPGASLLAGEALDQLAFIRLSRASYDEAEAAAMEAMRVRQGLLERNPDAREHRLAVAQAFETLGRVHERRGIELRGNGDAEASRASLTQADRALSRGVDIREELRAEDPGDSENTRRLLVLHERRGRVLKDLRRFDDAETAFRSASVLARERVAADPFSERALEELARSFENIGDVWFDAGERERAAEPYTLFRERADDLIARDPENRQRRRMGLLANKKLGDVAYTSGRYDEAETPYRRSLAHALHLRAADPTNVTIMRDTATVCYFLARTLERLGDDAGAAHAFSRGDEASRALEAATETTGRDRAFAGEFARGLARGALENEDGARAVQLFARAQTLRPLSDWPTLRDEARAFRMIGDPDAEHQRIQAALAAIGALDQPDDAANTARRELAARLDELGDG
jgi:serine/threonine protein kinase/tetratricopeptide (TPR) repeat protein